MTEKILSLYCCINEKLDNYSFFKTSKLIILDDLQKYLKNITDLSLFV